MSQIAEQLKGTGVAIVTPFDTKGNVDYKALDKIIQHLIKGKVEYIVSLGTTGETATLDKEEKKKIVAFTVKAVNKRIPVVLGLGGNNTREIIAAFKEFDLSGISAILSVSPYYNKPIQDGIIAHYKAIAKASPLPVVLYNVPGRTSSNMTSDTTLTLAKEKNIIGMKEASGNMEQIMRIAKHKPKDFLLISGDDNLTLPMLACGAEGVISVVANAYPKDFSEMTRQALKGNYAEARKLHYKLNEITELLFADGSPGGIKAVLKMMGLCQEVVRLPLANIGKATKDKLAAMVKNYK